MTNIHIGKTILKLYKQLPWVLGLSFSFFDFNLKLTGEGERNQPEYSKTISAWNEHQKKSELLPQILKKIIKSNIFPEEKQNRIPSYIALSDWTPTVWFFLPKNLKKKKRFHYSKVEMELTDKIYKRHTSFYLACSLHRTNGAIPSDTICALCNSNLE